jgi:hypothetical protein
LRIDFWSPLPERPKLFEKLNHPKSDNGHDMVASIQCAFARKSEETLMYVIEKASTEEFRSRESDRIKRI